MKKTAVNYSADLAAWTSVFLGSLISIVPNITLMIGYSSYRPRR